MKIDYAHQHDTSAVHEAWEAYRRFLATRDFGSLKGAPRIIPAKPMATRKEVRK